MPDEKESSEKGMLFSPIFDDYHKSRLLFLQSIANVASDSEAIIGLRASGAVALACPLLYDPSPNVQQAALLALGQLANYSQAMAEEMVSRNVLPLTVKKLVKQIQHKNHREDANADCHMFKRLSIFLFRSIAKQSAELAKAVVDANVLQLLEVCLEDEDEMIKQSALWVMINIAKHNEDLALQVISEKYGLLRLLMHILNSCNLSVVGVASSAAYELVKFPETTKILVKENIIEAISKSLELPDDAVKRIALASLAHISSHSESLAEEIGRKTHSVYFAIRMLKDESPVHSKNAAAYLFQCTKYDSELIDIILKEEGIMALISCIQIGSTKEIIPILLVLSNLASRGANIANRIIQEGLLTLANLLQSETAELEVKKIVTDIIGTIGSYSQDHANSVAEAKLVTLLASLSTTTTTVPPLRSKCKYNFKKILEQCIHLPTLEELLEHESSFIKKLILSQYGKILHTNGNTRKWFVSSGWLKKMQAMLSQSDDATAKLIGNINKCFPPEIVNSSTPAYLDKTLERIEKYEIPRTSIPPVMREASQNSSDWSLMVNPSLYSAESIQSESSFKNIKSENT